MGEDEELANLRQKRLMEMQQEALAKMKADVQATSAAAKGKALVFVSYATVDEPVYRIGQIAEILSSRDYIDDVLYWQEDMHDNIIKYMSDNLGKCDVVLLFCSQNALNSGPVEDEWTCAKALGKPIVPVFMNVEHIPILYGP